MGVTKVYWIKQPEYMILINKVWKHDAYKQSGFYVVKEKSTSVDDGTLRKLCFDCLSCHVCRELEYFSKFYRKLPKTIKL